MTPAATLQRSLTYWDLILYGLAYISPSAPLTTLGFIYTEADGLIVLAYIMGAICMYFTAKSYAIMTETVPTAGSVYGFARFALGAFPGFIAGWMILLDYLLIPAFIYVMFAVAMGTLIPAVDRSVWIILLVCISTGVNWYGIRVTAGANFIAVALQVIMVVGFVALGVVALHRGFGSGSLTLNPVFRPAAFHVGKMFSATSLVVMSFLGFDAISTLAEEVKGGDRRVVGRAIVAVLIISAAFFVLVTWVLGNLMQGVAFKDPATAAYDLAGITIGAWAGALLAWGNVLIVGLSNALPCQVGVARVVFAMGRDGQLPRIMARVHPTYRTPYVSMLSTAAISIGVALYMENRLDDLTSIVNFGALSGFLLLHVSVLAHFGWRNRSRHWFIHWVVPVIGIAVVLAVFSGMSPLASKVGLCWLAVGLVYGGFLKVKGREEFHVPI